MSQVTIKNAATGNDSSTQSILESLNSISDSISNRAFELSQSAGDSGDAIRNWMQAERDLFCVPEAQLSETDRQYTLQIAVPGCDANSLEVIALSNSIVLRSSSHRNTVSQQGRTVYSDLDSRTLLRRFDLTSSLDVNYIAASLDNGMLTITARKAASASKSSAANA